ncbi:hypothetical protein T440DRAFT_464288 [Plenodomus tracheiphilus IPT5]|uniref:Uncharacterized protein n=1 Tax=Plenodomus tracheiphilus IPT5 TaxID=1408161 RepID=A0A6A7BHV5_9PLEO|nr:hypothetical protein T440DRAFT_464288 [Plenodomus tracheiphilus IPT5]
MFKYHGPEQLDSIAFTLLQGTKLVHPPKKSQYSNLASIIADLHVHPTLEALLHILNHDLPSAHFLVRHMQAPPAVEGMLLHGILHRAEGDFPNAHAWISDVKDACAGYQPKKRDEGKKLDDEVAEKVGGGQGTDKSLVVFVYGEEEPGQLIDDVESFRRKTKSRRLGGQEAELEKRIREEGQNMLEWCKMKFGSAALVDASQAWVQNSAEINKISSDMVSGGRGYRQF